MLPRTALPVLCFRNDRAISIVSIEHKMTTIHRTATGSKYKMQCQTTTFCIQTYSQRILLNTPRIQDSRFKVQGKVLPGTLNLGSEAYSTAYVLNTFEYALSSSAARVLYEKIRKKHTIYRHAPDPINARRPAAEISEKGMETRASQEPMPSQSRD